MERVLRGKYRRKRNTGKGYKRTESKGEEKEGSCFKKRKRGETQAQCEIVFASTGRKRGCPWGEIKSKEGRGWEVVLDF